MDKASLISYTDESGDVKCPKSVQMYQRRRNWMKKILFVFLGVCVGFVVASLLLLVLLHCKEYLHRHSHKEGQNWFSRNFDDQKKYTHHKVSVEKCPRLITRKEWGARAPKEKEKKMPPGPANYAFIHHEGDKLSPCYSKAECIKRMQLIQNFHMDVRKWNDIAYSYLIGSDGNVYEGRKWNVVGSHTKGYNSVGYGFCVMGDYSKEIPAGTALMNLKSIIACGVEKKWLKTDYVLRGHRDMCNYTECPGDAFYALIKTWPHYTSTVHNAYVPYIDEQDQNHGNKTKHDQHKENNVTNKWRRRELRIRINYQPKWFSWQALRAFYSGKY